MIPFGMAAIGAVTGFIEGGSKPAGSTEESVYNASKGMVDGMIYWESLGLIGVIAPGLVSNPAGAVMTEASFETMLDTLYAFKDNVVLTLETVSWGFLTNVVTDGGLPFKKIGEIISNLKGAKNADDFIARIKQMIKDGTESSFTWKLRGEDVTLNDVKVQEISYVKRSSTELKTLRDEFNTTTRNGFLEDLGKDVEYLRNAEFSETDILKIQNGRVPDGWQVHHKLPLDDSGTNSFDNLVLIQNEPYHKVITNYQNSVAKKMELGEIQAVQWPIPNGNIYPAHH